MREGDILFYRTEQNNDWVGIFDHVSDEPTPSVYNKICVVAESGEMYTSVSEYVKRGSYRLCRLCEVEGFRAATPDEVQLLMNVLEKNGYYYDEQSKKLKKGPEKPEFQYGDFIYVKAIGCRKDNEWLSIFRGNSPDEILSVVDFDLEDKIFYTCPENPNGCLVHHSQVEECRLMTPEEKEVLVKALAKEGYRWNEEKKELEQISVEPKFEPFQKVLVRDYIPGNQDRFDALWHPDFFGSMWGDKYLTTSGIWNQCIPYEGNEHLLGTTESVK